MPFWKRGAHDDDASAPPPTPQPVVGSLPCSERGCTNATGEACGYVDRRGRSCGTAWCPDHQSMVGGTVFCRRHAGVVGALTGAEQPGGGMPDIENRAPSLVNWVSRDVGELVQQIVTSHSAELGTDRLVTDPVQLVFLGPERLRVWERAWKLVDHTGWGLRVALEVAEERDTEVAIRVGRNIAARLTPPWIAARRRGEQLAPEVDAEQRHEFYRQLTEEVSAAVAAELELRRQSRRP